MKHLPLTKLPPETDDDEDHRVVVTWQDAENPTDLGAECCSLWHLHRGDFDSPRYRHVQWASLMGSKAAKEVAKELQS